MIHNTFLIIMIHNTFLIIMIHNTFLIIMIHKIQFNISMRLCRAIEKINYLPFYHILFVKNACNKKTFNSKSIEVNF